MSQKDLSWYSVFNSFTLIEGRLSGFISNLCHPIAVRYLTSQDMMQFSTYEARYSTKFALQALIDFNRASNPRMIADQVILI